MKLPELPYVSEIVNGLWEQIYGPYTDENMTKYGSERYAKGRADLLKEIGEPVAWLDENGFPKHIHNLRLIAEVWKPLYVLPKEKS